MNGYDKRSKFVGIDPCQIRQLHRFVLQFGALLASRNRDLGVINWRVSIYHNNNKKNCINNPSRSALCVHLFLSSFSEAMKFRFKRILLVPLFLLLLLISLLLVFSFSSSSYSPSNWGRGCWKAPFRPTDLLPLLPRIVSWPILRSLRSAVDLLPTFVGAASSTNDDLEWKGACFYKNRAWLEFHNNSGTPFGGGTLHIKVGQKKKKASVLDVFWGFKLGRRENFDAFFAF